jgi:hypothetical protein
MNGETLRTRAGICWKANKWNPAGARLASPCRVGESVPTLISSVRIILAECSNQSSDSTSLQ